MRLAGVPTSDSAAASTFTALRYLAEAEAEVETEEAG
jgi:hypothetical protein